jgi:hypothetical protein|tara:strand:- start:879 stop:1022 length:144 start_codon:yes stop_codon:yes gene_type:complete
MTVEGQLAGGYGETFTGQRRGQDFFIGIEEDVINHTANLTDKVLVLH